MTGFQSKYLDKEFLLKYMQGLFDNSIYEFEFIQSGLRSAVDIYKKGGHMISKYSDKNYTIFYDNRRCIIESDKEVKTNLLSKDVKTTLLDTKP